LKKITELIKTT